MEYEVILNLKIDPDSYTFELGKENHSDDVTELIHRLIYEVEDVKILECEATLLWQTALQ